MGILRASMHADLYGMDEQLNWCIMEFDFVQMLYFGSAVMIDEAGFASVNTKYLF